MCIRLYRQNETPSSETILLNGADSSAPVSNPPGLRRNKRRKKIWELEHRFHCSIAGTCFTLDELRRFCRKVQGKVKRPISDYELHITFVGILENAHAARPANKYLDRKYRTAIQCFDPANSPGELLKLWNEAVSQGEIASAFWALTTHPLASKELLFRVFGEVHMLSHLSGASIRLDMQALTQLRQRVPELEQSLTQSRTELLRRTRQKDEIIETLNQRLKKALQSERKLQAAEEKIQRLESGEILRHWQTQVAAYTDKFENASLRAERAEADSTEQKERADTSLIQNLHQESRLLALTTERGALENALENALSAKHGVCKRSGVCQKNFDLAGRSILYVGGHNRLCAHFRTLVEQQNGYFIHHDGGREESPQRLDALLSQVDAVLCPMDCVSHDAVARIKRNCKRNGKYLMLLPQSSLSAFTKGVHEFSRVLQ